VTLPCLLLALLPVAARASPWIFGPAVPVTAAGGERVFHHLESAGRKSVAVSGATVTVTWEDNRDATPGVYVSLS
jgi:hypothetical protein